MKKTMDLRYSREKTIIKMKRRLKVKKALPILAPLGIVFSISLIVMVMNFHCLYVIKGVDDQLVESQKLEIVFENLEQKSYAVNSRKKIVELLEAKNRLAYQVIANIQTALTKDTELVKVEYQEGKVSIIGRCRSQDEISEFSNNLDKIRGWGQTKLCHIANLNVEGSIEGSDSIWEFSLESDIEG